ncbi:ROK family protein [Caproiciproducens faecalis]|uniref:ROK family protein n=1 Tax=Caproiciproducens faecalis TaxID=2820301 RepID=A0ABS7DJ70_9FIRM|nr:ROK family protein [Caproiciproducens faecalis]MBW7571344.1 ROK family protein [Caproiciproducens faecalis]
MERKKSFNQEKIQIVNRSLVLDLIRQQTICSRSTLASLSGLRLMTITNIINELMSCGLVVETGLMSGNRGRRSVGLKLNDDKYKVIGVRMTRSVFYVGLFGLSGQICKKKEYKVSHNEDVEVTIARIRSAIQLTLNENRDCSVLSAAIAIPGPYREDIDRLLFVTELPGWQNYPIKEALTKNLGIPLYIINDADASAFSQYWYRDKKYLIYVLAGQGIGSGLVIDGKLARGSTGLGGEFGHTSINFNGPECFCGNHGCIEKYCSLLVLYENIKSRLKAKEPSCLFIDNITTETVSVAVKNGDRVACEEYKKVCALLSIGIVNLVNQFNPDIIVLGDELTQIDPDFMLSIVNDKIKQCIQPLTQKGLTVEINPLSENPSLLGAGAIAAQHMIDDPSCIMNQLRR